MGKNINMLSLASQGLRYKLKISFYLMSILPLLVCVYLVSSYILPGVGLKIDIIISIAISLFIAIVGFLVIKEVFDRIVSVSNEAKLIAAGDTNRVLEAGHMDEVGDLGGSLNQLTQRIRSNMNELKSYSEKTTEINIEIQKRVIVLSSLLQISSLISQGARLEDILKLTTEKSRLLANSDICYLLFREEEKESFFMKEVDGLNCEGLLKISISANDNLFKKVISNNTLLVIDKQNEPHGNLKDSLYQKFLVNNTIALPVYLKGKVAAILGIGNKKEPFLYTREDIELLDIFAKQVSIAIENDLLTHHIEKLEIKDALTGLYNETFVRNRLQEEIRRAIAYQRPCAFIMFDIDNFKAFQQNYGSLKTEAVLKRVASLINDSISEIDRAGRLGDDEFAVILPEKNKRRAQETAEDIRKKIEFIFSESPQADQKLTVSAGVSENPLDGMEAKDLIKSAKDLLDFAKKQGKNRVAVSLKEPPICR